MKASRSLGRNFSHMSTQALDHEIDSFDESRDPVKHERMKREVKRRERNKRSARLDKTADWR